MRNEGIIITAPQRGSEHDGGTGTRRCCRKRPLRSKPSADQTDYAHGDFRDENYIGRRSSGRFRNASIKQIASTQTTNCVSFMLGKNLARHSGCFTSLEAHLSRSIHSTEKTA